MGDGMGIWELRSAALLANESAISFPARPEWLLTHVNFHLYFWSNCESLLQQRNTVLDEVCDFSIACMADLLSENISTPGATTPSCTFVFKLVKNQGDQMVLVKSRPMPRKKSPKIAESVLTCFCG